MPVTVPSRQEINTFIQDALRERAGVTNFSESSIAGTLTNVMAVLLSDMYGNLAEIESRNSLSTAYGPYLDRIGEMFGVTRLAAKSATTVGSGRAVLFTNPTGTAIVVAKGTRIWAPNNYSLAYYTEIDVSVPPADANGNAGRAYVDVTSTGTGTFYNASPGTLTAHNAGSQLLQVTNVRAITNGTELESDENYRYRIKNAILSRQGANETTLRMRLLELPGVRDVVIKPMARGTGTVDVVIVPVDRYVTQTLRDQAQSEAEASVPLGVSVLVKPPVERPVDIDIQIAVSSTADRITAKTLATSAVQAYVDNLPIGDDSGSGDLILSKIISAAQDASPDVRSVNLAKVKVDNKLANEVDQKALPGERFYLQSIKVV